MSSRFKGHWQSILDGDPTAMLEVPFWIWKGMIADLTSLLADNAEDGEILFTYKNVVDYLRWCRCVVGSNGIQIQPLVTPIEKASAFTECQHRLYMSATLAEDSVIVRDLGCDKKAVLSPLIPKSDRGLGERMVIAPSLIHHKFDRTWVMRLSQKLAEKVNVVVLTSSEDQALEWEEFGAEVAVGNQVDEMVKRLRAKDSSTTFAAFPQRYDGVDLPDKACRVLVIDGLPKGEGIIERFDFEKALFTSGPQNKTIFKIEQGLGRPVRSHVDYSVVIFAGPDIAHYIAKRDVQERMNRDTQAQMILSLKLVEMAINSEEDTQEELKRRRAAILDMIMKCLNRNSGWKKFYNKEVRDKVNLVEVPIDEDV
ncbi:hypothetical protein KC573_04570, partial [candidate division WWE3 bacterium]|nr:hypothetical protein [candidate division WWE3 bacterium]